MSGFKKAVKSQSKLRLALIGPAGSGKTFSALAIASSLGKRIAVIDTEHGSASKYADLFDFDVMTLDSFHPQRYTEGIREAEKAGYELLVIDSLSHAWVGKDGGLELHDRAVAKQRTANKYTAWAEVTPHHNALIESILQSNCHVIATMRSKMDYVQDKDESGRTVVKKVGMAPLMRDGIEYEFDIAGDIDLQHRLIISKTRIPSLEGQIIDKPGRAFAETLAAWLGSGKPEDPPSPAKRVLKAFESCNFRWENEKTRQWAYKQIGRTVDRLDELTHADADAIAAGCAAHLEKKKKPPAPEKDKPAEPSSVKQPDPEPAPKNRGDNFKPPASNPDQLKKQRTERVLAALQSCGQRWLDSKCRGRLCELLGLQALPEFAGDLTDEHVAKIETYCKDYAAKKAAKKQGSAA